MVKKFILSVSESAKTGGEKVHIIKSNTDPDNEEISVKMNLWLLFTTLLLIWDSSKAQNEEELLLMVVGGWGGYPGSSDVDLVSLDPDIEV